LTHIGVHGDRLTLREPQLSVGEDDESEDEESGSRDAETRPVLTLQGRGSDADSLPSLVEALDLRIVGGLYRLNLSLVMIVADLVRLRDLTIELPGHENRGNRAERHYDTSWYATGIDEDERPDESHRRDEEVVEIVFDETDDSVRHVGPGYPGGGGSVLVTSEVVEDDLVVDLKIDLRVEDHPLVDEGALEQEGCQEQTDERVLSAEQAIDRLPEEPRLDEQDHLRDEHIRVDPDDRPLMS